MGFTWQEARIRISGDGVEIMFWPDGLGLACEVVYLGGIFPVD